MEEVDLEELGIPLKIDLRNPTFNFNKNVYFEDIHGNIIDKLKKKRCTIKYKNKTISGGYGFITFATRISDSDMKNCVVKRLLSNDQINLYKEAFLQHLSFKLLQKYNLQKFVPQVYDIFTRMDTKDRKEVLHFSMQEIVGKTINSFLESSENPQNDFLDCFIQIAVALYILEKEIILDHRDLRYANIFVVNHPISIPLKIFNKDSVYSCNFHICIIDFGFACIGHKPTTINAAEGFMQNEERCFKPGRDLFQLLVSVWSKKNIRDKMSKEFIEKINYLLRYKNHDYSKIIELKSDSKWPYSLTVDDDFSFVPLLPQNLLKYLFELKKIYDNSNK